MPRLELDDPVAYQNFQNCGIPKLHPSSFKSSSRDSLLKLQWERTWMREPLSPGLKFTVTLRHLAIGDSYPTLQYAFRVARSTINKFVPEVCDAFSRAYQDDRSMPWVPWMERTSQSDVQDVVATSNTTIRTSTL